MYKGLAAGHTRLQIITAELVTWLSLFSENAKEIDVKPQIISLICDVLNR